MNSLQLEQLLGCYIDDELPPDRMAEVERLLRYNTMAKKIYDELASIRQELQRIPRRNVKYDFQEQLFARIDATIPGYTSESAPKWSYKEKEETISEQPQTFKRNPVNWVLSIIAVVACFFCCVAVWQNVHRTKTNGNVVANHPQNGATDSGETSEKIDVNKPYFSPPPLSANRSNSSGLQTNLQTVITTDKPIVVDVSCRLTTDAYEKQYIPKLLADADIEFTIRQNGNKKATVYEFQTMPQDFMPIILQLHKDRDKVLNYQLSDAFLSLFQRPEAAPENTAGPTTLVLIHFNVQTD
ncbi:MAG: hypothetical protein LBT05_12755 [Planctomycetaceae bacterium]|jgi:hypothetical protein|nr:hypothetical protein [Planctomycetaceae bacterium]